MVLQSHADYIMINTLVFFETLTQVELCIKILSDILKLLHKKNVGNTFDDIQEIIKTDLRTAIQTHIHMHRENPHDVSYSFG